VDQSTQLVETGSDVDAFEAARSVRGVKAFLLASGGTFLRIPGGSTNDFPIDDGTGSIVGASAIARDFTEQKQAEAALRRKLDQGAHLNRVAAMVGSQPTELNQPLAAILNNAQAARQFLQWPMC
jgi:C4-dicarboxylate-specific signal transduction histidine kinase